MRKYKPILIMFITFLSIIPLLPLIHQGLFKSHDSEIHVARLASFYTSFVEGNLFPRWGANLNYGYGHPTLMFLYPLPNYLGVAIHKLGFSFIDTTKLLFALSFILSGVFMFYFLNKLFSEMSAFFGTIVYLFTPFRFAEMYVRGALPEHLFFTFAPLVMFLFLIYLEQTNRFIFILLSLFLVALILTHILASIIFFPFLFLFLAILLQKKIKHIGKTFILLCAPFLVAVMLAFFFWFPAVIESKYTLHNLIFNKEFTTSHLTDIKNLIMPSWGYGDPRFANGLSLQIGVLNLIVLTVAIFLLLKKKLQTKVMLIYLIGLFLLSTFLMIKNSLPFWESNDFLHLLIYPWRLLILIVIISPILSSIVIDYFEKKWLPSKTTKAVFVLVISILVFGLTYSYQQIAGFIDRTDEYFLSSYPGTADSGESSPIWTTLTQTGENFTSQVEVIDGKVKIEDVKKMSERHSFQAIVISDKARLVDNTLYFPGWTLYDNGKNRTTSIQYQDPKFRGLITFEIEQGQHDLLLLFQDTKVRRFATLVTLASLLLLLFPINIFAVKIENKGKIL